MVENASSLLKFHQVNKADMIKRTADLVNDKKIDGIANIRDESDRNGMRIVYILKRDDPNVVLNTLYKLHNYNPF
jgi:DNA gyrase subunit A